MNLTEYHPCCVFLKLRIFADRMVCGPLLHAAELPHPSLLVEIGSPHRSSDVKCGKKGIITEDIRRKDNEVNAGVEDWFDISVKLLRDIIKLQS